MTIHDFDDIRPFLPEELPAVYDRLLQDAEFLGVLSYIYKEIPSQQVAALMRGSKTNLEFQHNLVYPLLQRLVQQASKGLSSNFDPILGERGQAHTFVSNHRDIVLDSAFLNYVLHAQGIDTAEIAIGDNLLIRPWIRDLVRINKSFIVQRGLPIRQLLLASVHLSRYMLFAVQEKKANVWIAQREGRAKDSDDRTQDSVLKMMALGGDLRELHIVPLAITYEYDPCDYLKAQEFQLKRDDPNWKKAPQDDLQNMRTGIFGWKGKVHYHAAPCINTWLDTLPAGMPKGEYFRAVAAHIDREIHAHYHLYPGNYVAIDELQGHADHAEHYTPVQRTAFLQYVDGQLAKLGKEGSCAEYSTFAPDFPYLRERLLTMYANPVRNHEKAL